MLPLVRACGVKQKCRHADSSRGRVPQRNVCRSCAGAGPSAASSRPCVGAAAGGRRIKRASGSSKGTSRLTAGKLSKQELDGHEIRPLVLSGKPGTLLCRAPLRTGLAAFTASGSSKPLGFGGASAVRSPRRNANQHRPSQGSRPLVRSPRRSSRRLTCPRVPVLSSSSSQAHLTASARFRVRAQGPLSGLLSETTTWRERPSCPVSRRLSAAGIRFSVIRCPPRSWALLTVGLPDTPKSVPGPRRGYRVPHARATTGVGAPNTPRTAVLLPD